MSTVSGPNQFPPARFGAAFLLCVGLAACGTNESRVDGTTNPDLIGSDAGADSGFLPDGAPITPDSGDDTTDDVDPDDDTLTGPDGESPDAGGDPLPGGESCQTNRDCSPGFVCETAFGPAFCAPAPDEETNRACETQSDCNLANSDDTFCCAGFFGGTRCAPAGQSGVCGDASGGQADSCSESGQSQCSGENALCVFGEQDFAYCAEVCLPPAYRCPSGAYCREFGPGQAGVCLEYGETESYDSCIDDPTGCEEDAFCLDNTENPELSFCASFCESDSDCGDDESCSFVGVCLPAGGAGVGESCAEDRFGCASGLLCIGYGSRRAQCTERCTSDSDCGSDTFCFDAQDGASYCIRSGDRAQGEFCGDDLNACRGVCSSGDLGYDVSAVCVDRCESDSDCPDNTYCSDASPDGQRFCVGDGPLGQGGDCTLDPFLCARDSVCLGYGSSSASCISPCFDSSDCGSGNWCIRVNEEFGYCVPAGEGSPGESCEDDRFSCAAGSVCGGPGEDVCFTICTSDPGRCRDGEECLALGDAGESFCYPVGDVPYGGDCADDIYGCELGTYCAEAGLPSARCTRGCASDSDCDGDDWCYEAVEGRFCRPAGEAEAMESCEDDQWACEAGLACILSGARGSFCADECTGFSARCGADQTCTYVGYSRSFCVDTATETQGESCVDDQFSCAPGHWCVGAGSEEASCVKTCSFAPGSCPDGTTCRFLASGLGLCLGAGLAPDDPLNPGGSPL
jgi:hypothetical protein